MKEVFIRKKFQATSLAVIDKANTIIDDYRSQGYRMTLRQLYYQLVSKNEILNTIQSYKKLGDIVSLARNAGRIDWDALHDEGRPMRGLWPNMADMTPQRYVAGTPNGFTLDLWQGQPWHVSVMVEKAALGNVVQRAAGELSIPWAANKGYTSSSALYALGKIHKEALDMGRNVFIVYLGDHDPSGIDMTRDIDDRAKLYARYHTCTGLNDEKPIFEPNDEYKDRQFIVHRAALNMSQVQQYKPPENPAKVEDSRYASYVKLYGKSSWELDALLPSVIVDLVKSAVHDKVDHELMAKRRVKIEEGRDYIRRVAEINPDDLDEFKAREATYAARVEAEAKARAAVVDLALRRTAEPGWQRDRRLGRA